MKELANRDKPEKMANKIAVHVLGVHTSLS